MGNECRCHHAEVEYGHTSFHVVDPKMRDEHVEDAPRVAGGSSWTSSGCILWP
jgi:hypothetical protein